MSLLFLIHFHVPGGREHNKESYEVLTAVHDDAEFEWIYSSNGEVPPLAIQGGHTSLDEPLYIGRVVHNGELLPGKIHPRENGCFISYGGQEYKYTSN